MGRSKWAVVSMISASMAMCASAIATFFTVLAAISLERHCRKNSKLSKPRK